MIVLTIAFELYLIFFPQMFKMVLFFLKTNILGCCKYPQSCFEQTLINNKYPSEPQFYN